jgi:hypothetical protein
MSTKLTGKFTASELHLPNGGWLDFWAKNADIVKQFINSAKLNPVMVSSAVQGRSAKAKGASLSRLLDLGIAGGIRLAHLHFENEVYLLDQEQWAKFSTKVMKVSKTALTSAKTISFDAAMGIQSALQGVR